MKETYTFESLGIQGKFHLEDIPRMPIEDLPTYSQKTNQLIDKKGAVRATLLSEKSVGHGSYGNLFLTVRVAEKEQHAVLLKQPRMTEMNLFQEAILQSIAQEEAEKAGIGWSIPKVYDIFWRERKVWFSMDYIPGMSVLDWFQQTKEGDRDFFLLLAQLSLYLYFLEMQLGLDHRDLKLDNLLLKSQPCDISLRFNETIWKLHSPFTVVILDFGFACAGSKEIRGKPIVNLGDGILPPMDPCPKEGRDLFHFLTSFLGVESLVQKLSPTTVKRVDEWLSVGKKSYGALARRWSTENWTYLVSSQQNFAIPSCCPLTILKAILPDLQGNLSCK